MTRRTVAAALMMLHLAAAAAVGAQQPPRVIAVPPAMYAKAECPHYWGSSPLDTFPIAGKTTNVPEYNDCQQLIVANAGGLSYGPLASIFVRENVTKVFTPFPTPAQPPVVVTVPPVLPAVFRTEVVAIVFANAGYAPLGLKRGFNCLVLKWGPLPGSAKPNPASYAAWMTPVPDAGSCSNTTTIGNPAAGILLRVKPVAVTGGDPIPPISRFDWDVESRVHYISMVCPTGWCEIGRMQPSFVSSPLYPGPAWLAAGRHVTRVKGWFDEQLLAGPPTAQIAKLTSNLVKGTAFPVPGLQGRGIEAYKGRGWVDVGWVALSDDSPEYMSKFGFVKNVAPGSNAKTNAIALCFHAKQGDCNGTLPTCTQSDSYHVGTWYTRIMTSGSAPRYYCVTYRKSPYDNIQPPGVLRWRWKLNDETLWISCPVGCCEVEPGNSIGGPI